MLSLAVYLKRKRKLRWDFSSGQGLFPSINYILCKCIFTVKAEIHKEDSKAFHLPFQGLIHVHGQGKKKKPDHQTQCST